MTEPDKTKSPQQSKVIKTEIVCPNDANPMGILMGGRLVHWMDMTAAVCAQTHAERICVTASLDKISFDHPVQVGDIVTLEANVTRAFNTSVEIYVQVWTHAVGNNKNQKISESYFTFVALDGEHKPAKMMQVTPHTEEESKLFNDAGNRKSRQ